MHSHAWSTSNIHWSFDLSISSCCFFHCSKPISKNWGNIPDFTHSEWRALCSVTLAILCGSSSELINCLCRKRPNVLQISNIPHCITVQYWQIINNSIFKNGDFLFHTVHLSLFLSTQWYSMTNTSIAYFPTFLALSSRYTMSRPFFPIFPLCLSSLLSPSLNLDRL